MTVENHPSDCGIWNKEGRCLIPLALMEALPLYHRETIPSDYLDIMGHMNIRWYFDLFAKSGRKFLHLMDWMMIAFEAENSASLR